MITRWRDDLDGTWHESGDLDGWDYEQEARRVQYEEEMAAFEQRKQAWMYSYRQRMFAKETEGGHLTEEAAFILDLIESALMPF